MLIWVWKIIKFQIRLSFKMRVDMVLKNRSLRSPKSLLISLFILFTIVLFSFPLYAQDNYCLDKNSWKEWDELALKHPSNKDVQMLHAVRIGLCQKIEDGTISFEVARDAFNHIHETVHKRALEEQKRHLENSQL